MIIIDLDDKIIGLVRDKIASNIGDCICNVSDKNILESIEQIGVDFYGLMLKDSRFNKQDLDGIVIG